MIKQRVRLLLLDDDEKLRSELKEFLEQKFSYSVDAVGERAEALRLARVANGDYDVALIDQMLGEGAVGIEVLRELKELDQELEGIVFTGAGSEFRQEALKAGAFHYIQKPVDYDELAQLIRVAAQQSKLREINRTLFSTRDTRQVLDEIIDAAISLASADDAAIVLLDPASGELEIHSETQGDQPVWRRTLREASLSRTIIHTGEMVRIGDTKEDGRLDWGVLSAGIRSLQGLPIPGEGNNLGVLYVYSYTPGRFANWGTISVLQTLAGRAGLALSNLQAFRRMQEQAERMEALVRTSRGLTKAKKLKRQLKLVDGFMRDQLQVSIFYVGLHKRRSNVIRVPLARDHGKREWLDDLPLRDDEGNWTASGYVIETGEELFWRSQAEEEEKCSEFGIRTYLWGEPPEPETCFYVPLRLGKKVLGLISIQSTQRGAFPAELLDAFRALANQLSAALESSRLLKRSRAATSQLSTLNEVVLEVGRESDRTALLNKIIEQAIKLLGAEGAAVFLLNPAGDRFERVAEAGLPLDFDGQIPVDEGLTGEVVSTGRARQVPDYKTWEKRLRQLDGQRLTAVLAQPISVEDRIVGTVVIHDTRPGKRFDQVLLEQFASHASLALNKAMLLEQVREAKAAARVVAEVTVLEEPKKSLSIVAERTKKIVGCDAVVLFVFNQRTNELEHPPTMVGVRYEDRASSLKLVEPASIVYQMLERDDLYLVEKVAEDDLFRSKRFARDEEIESLVAIPLRAAGQKVGVMFVNYRTPHLFTEDELANLVLFSNQAAVAIRNSQLYEQQKRWADLQGALIEASHVVSGSLNLREVLDNVAQQAWEVCKYSGRECALFSSVALMEDDTLIRAATYPTDRLQDLATVIGRMSLSSPDGQRIGIVGRAAVEEKAQWVGDVEQDPDYIRFEPRTRSELAVPMVVGGKVIGVVDLEHNQPDAFQEEEVYALSSLAAQAGLAIQHARLYQAERVVAQGMIAILSTSSAVGDILDLERLLLIITEEAAGIFGAPASSLMLWDEPKENLVIRTAFGLGDRYRREQQVPRSKVESLVRAKGLKPQAFNIAKNPFGRLDLIEEEGLCTALVAPLVKGEEMTGVLCVYSKHEPRLFGARAKELATVLANHATIAIDNVQRYEALRKIKGLVGSRTALDWIQMVSTVWGHSIRREVGNAKASAALLRAAIGSRHEQMALQELGDLEQILDLIGETPIMAPLSTEDQVASIRINQLIDAYMGRLRAHRRYATINIVLDLQDGLDDEFTVRASEGWLRRGLEVLVENAVRAMLDASSEPRQLSVTTRLVDGKLQLQVRDTGPGIPAELRRLLFREPIGQEQGAKGAGIGLLLAQMIFETYRGTIEVEDRQGPGATFVIYLPIEKNSQRRNV